MSESVSRPLRVFLCHASGDKPVVRELCHKLAFEGWIDPWLDAKKLLPGQDWRKAIEEAVEAADNVIICLSRVSVNKEGFVQKEMRYAREIALEKPEGTIFLIPLRLDDCEVPRGLKFLQWVDYFGQSKEQSYNDLLESLKIRLEERIRKDAEDCERKELEERIKREAREKVRREMEERLRKEAEERARQEYEAQEELPGKKKAAPPVAVPKSILDIGLVKAEWGGIEFVKIPAGPFLMGSKDDNALAEYNEKPQHTVNIPYDYWMARFPVTNEQYAAFIGKGKHPVGDWQEKQDHPVVRVSWKDAMAYCNWLTDLLAGHLPQDLVLRLPTEAEWEKAARGVDGREWPWGNEFDKDKCNSCKSGKGGTTSVGAYSPQGDSPYGCADMIGNIWEWTHSLFKAYPYKANSSREDETDPDRRILRGGSFAFYEKLARCASRYVTYPNIEWYNTGFRVGVAGASPILFGS